MSWLIRSGLTVKLYWPANIPRPRNARLAVVTRLKMAFHLASRAYAFLDTFHMSDEDAACVKTLRDASRTLLMEVTEQPSASASP